MYFESSTNQWLLENNETYRITGMEIARKLLIKSVSIIAAGQVLVFDKSDMYDRVVFQVLENIDLSSVRPNNLVGYEPGSVISLECKKPPRIIPTFVFRSCRFPTISEYANYERINSI